MPANGARAIGGAARSFRVTLTSRARRAPAASLAARRGASSARPRRRTRARSRARRRANRPARATRPPPSDHSPTQIAPSADHHCALDKTRPVSTARPWRPEPQSVKPWTYCVTRRQNERPAYAVTLPAAIRRTCDAAGLPRKRHRVSREGDCQGDRDRRAAIVARGPSSPADTTSCAERSAG
jgi:hypothetical protein